MTSGTASGGCRVEAAPPCSYKTHVFCMVPGLARPGICRKIIFFEYFWIFLFLFLAIFCSCVNVFHYFFKLIDFILFIDMAPGLARPGILLFIRFWALPGPEYYYL